MTIVNSFFTVGLYRAALKQVHGERFNLADLFRGENTVRAMLANTVYQIAVVVSAVALVLPAFVVAMLGILTVPIALEHGEGARNSFKRSWSALRKHWLAATLFVTIAGLMSISGAVLFYLGVFVTTPLLYLCVARLYENCLGSTDADDGNTMVNDGITLEMPLPPRIGVEGVHT